LEVSQSDDGNQPRIMQSITSLATDYSHSFKGHHHQAILGTSSNLLCIVGNVAMAHSHKTFVDHLMPDLQTSI
jgi:hypothetical protein